MGVDEVEMIMGNCPITIPTVYILSSSKYGVEIDEICLARFLAKSSSTNLYLVHVVCNSHYILCITFVTTGGPEQEIGRLAGVVVYIHMFFFG